MATNRLLFKSGGNIYTFDSSVKEIIKKISITPTPNVPEYFVGTTTHREEIIPVLNLESILDDGNIGENGNREEIYISTENRNNSFIFQVEELIGSINYENDFQELIMPFDDIFYDKALLYDDIPVIQINYSKFTEIITQELRNFGKLFINQNTAIQQRKLISRPIIDEINIPIQQPIAIPHKREERRQKIKTRKNETSYSAIVIQTKTVRILIPNNYILEVQKQGLKISEIPKSSSPAMIGLIDYQGDVTSVFSLEEILFPYSTTLKEHKALLKSGMILIVELNAERFALVVREVVSIINIRKQDVKRSISHKNSQYIFSGAITTDNNEILLILDIEKLYTDITEENHSQDQVLHFMNPLDDLRKQKRVLSNDKGILCKNDDILIFISDKHVIQVHDRSSWFLKEFSDPVLKGAVVHTEIVPLLDLSYFLSDHRESYTSMNDSQSFLLKSTENDSQLAYSVDNVYGRVSISDFESYRKITTSGEKLLQNGFSGFFSYQENLGMILDPTSLINESLEYLDNSYGLTITNGDFATLFDLQELKRLETIRDINREAVSLTNRFTKENARNLFLFKLGSFTLAFNAIYVQRVYLSLKSESLKLQDHPILAVANINGDSVPIIDLYSIIFDPSFIRDKNQQSFMFSISFQEKTVLIPSDLIISLESVYTNEMLSINDNEIVTETRNVFHSKYRKKDTSETIYIIKDEFIEGLFSYTKM